MCCAMQRMKRDLGGEIEGGRCQRRLSNRGKDIPNRFLREAVAMGGVHGRGDFGPVRFRIDGVEDGDAEL